MITVLGSINVDLFVTVDRLPRPGETVIGHDFVTAEGGKGANQALAAQRGGGQVRLHGIVGTDAFASHALQLLDDAGVDLGSVQRIDGATGTALITVDHSGENTIAVVAGANGHVSQADATDAVDRMQAGDHLLLQLEIAPEAVAAALRAGRQKGVVSVLNTAPLTEAAAELAALADIVVANETEFALLVGRAGIAADQRETELLRRHRESGQTLILTLGADGVVAARDGALVRAEGLTIEPVDTVGAGDTFCGYLAAGLDSGLDFERALRQAAVAGSLACLAHGAQPAIPYLSDVDKALG